MSDDRKGEAWGFWATMGFSVIALVALLGVQGIFAFAVLGAQYPHLDLKGLASVAKKSRYAGYYASLSVCASAPVACGLTWLFARLKRGATAREYFRLYWPGWRTLAAWVMVVFAFVFGTGWAAALLGVRPPSFTEEIVGTTHSITLLFVAVVVLAPASEELIFRGFMFRGIMSSRLGVSGAVVLTSAVWSALHIPEYTFFWVADIFVFGLLLGVARARTGSLLAPLSMHMAMNFYGVALNLVNLGYRQ